MTFLPYILFDSTIDGQKFQVKKFACDSLRGSVRQWRTGWEELPEQERNDSLLTHLRNCRMQSDEANLGNAENQEAGTLGNAENQDNQENAERTEKRKRLGCAGLTFLGVPLCSRAFRYVLGINPWRQYKLLKRGAVRYVRPKFVNTPHPRYDEMYGAICRKVKLLANSSPFAFGNKGRGEDIIEMPFHEKIYLFRMIQADFESEAMQGERVPSFSRAPNYSTFRTVLKDPHFKNLRFHRVVDIGRCAKCCMLFK